MIFVGSRDKGYFAEEICDKQELAFAYIDSKNHIAMQVNDILDYGKQDYTIFDIDQYIDESDVIADYVMKICNANNSQPVILASGYLKSASVIVDLTEQGVKYFIFASVLAEMKDQLLKCMNGFYDANGIEFLEEVKKTAVEEAVATDCKSIAVAGTSSRIGTTTVAIQIIRYLQMKGKRACYIQMNRSKYMDSMREWYVVDEDEELGKVIYQNVDHYYKLSNIREILSQNYDFYIYDYGVYFDTDFNKISFLERDIQIFVAGTDPAEMPDTVNIIRSSFYDNVNYIFNFTPEADRDDVLALMEEKQERTFFLSYVPDKYVYVPNDSYAAIIPLPDQEEEERSAAKRKGIFGKWKK